ncbi:MAG: glycosyltransferase family 4 protein [Candidatus Roizmanbacteria bacterium]|nr:MAG: glycosyltransferase family 4 protein [Candidatus Roizmanbacteria bacterium]
MKTVGIDARLYFQTGVGVYLRNLIYYLQKIRLNDLRFNIYILKSDSDNIHFENKNFIKREVTSRWHSLSEQISFKKDLDKDNLDLMHFTYFSYPVLYDKKFIATIHDLTPLLFKTGKASTQNPFVYELKYLVFKYILYNQVKKALHIITPTKTVKKQILEVYGVQLKSKVTSLYEGVDSALIEKEGNAALADKFKRPFFIYVGTFYPHKNVKNLIKAFSNIKESIRLVLVGPQDYFASEILALIRQLHQEDRIVLFTPSTREDVIFFYKNASALIHPSLSEGFGLPIMEAAYYNLPIIASDIEVFKEILDSQYIFFNPNDVNDITQKIHKFLSEKPQFDYKKLVARYSFQKMAEETLKIYKNSL